MEACDDFDELDGVGENVVLEVAVGTDDVIVGESVLLLMTLLEERDADVDSKGEVMLEDRAVIDDCLELNVLDRGVVEGRVVELLDEEVTTLLEVREVIDDLRVDELVLTVDVDLRVELVLTVVGALTELDRLDELVELFEVFLNVDDELVFLVPNK